MVDDNLIGRLLRVLDELNIDRDTTLVIMSDHGTNLGEHAVERIPWRKEVIMYPQHTTMLDEDLKVVMILKGRGLPEGKTVKGGARSIDLIPTLLDLMGISVEEFDFDGESLLPAIQRGKVEYREGYAEDLFELRGKGALQCIRTDGFKYIRNLSLWTEEYYDLVNDPQEKNNIIEKIDPNTIISLRKKLNVFLSTRVPREKAISQEEIAKINERLRRLGYME